ncbi:iron complex outermembrane recepter protein [Sphingopyxis indica]|uniref:Iron complex outermembrane recepter protein n=1 Tax=Sphingopyxis indica TaxID=436663 RepID=A0A239GDB1_9SPHN|nr:iron complex outermembrane recepter protein [Sphingopyxis indica]
MKSMIDAPSHLRRHLGLASLSAIAVVIATPAFAQTDETAPEDGDVAAAPAPAPDESIVVTGSRIRTVTPFNSPDPISVIDPEIAAKEGKFDLASTLQSSPVAAGSTQITAAISSNFVTNGGPGAQTIDLRGLGPNRTLVLLNGRRAGPAGTRGGVSSFDLNVLPASIASSVEILKTGASSVYGSDAVAGVVNIKTKTDIDGLQLDFNTSVPFDSGGEEYRASALWGKTFSRGHFLIAGDYTHVKELARGDRSYLACPEAYTFREDGSRADLIDPRTGKPRCQDLPWGHVWTYNLIDNMQLDGPGGPNTGLNTSPNGETVLIQYQYPGETLGIPAYGAPAYFGDLGTPAGWYPVGYNTESQRVLNAYHPFYDEQTIIPKTTLITGYAEGSYELTDDVEMFGEFLFNRRKTYQNGFRQFWNFGFTGDLYGTGNLYGSGTIWAPGWQGVNFLSPTAITNHADSSQKVDYYRGVAGLRGEAPEGEGFFGGWRWEIYGQYSKSIGRYRSEQILQDVYETGYFQSSSCVGTVTPVSGKQCIDLPWADPYFLRGELTPEQVDFLFDWEEGKTVYTQLTGEATVSGALFDLPAGPVSIALGLNGRQDKINDVPGEITLAANAWGASASGITAGKSFTKEAFAEINVPVLANKPFFEELTLSAAARVTSVKATRRSDGVSDEDNGNWTYKIGANWALNDWLRFRASYGTSFRAPALFEQFLADETGFVSQRNIDPCIQWQRGLDQGTTSDRVAANCAADGIPGNYPGGSITATSISSGGLGDLQSETSNALVVGGILTPKFDFLPDTTLNIAVDYFDIKVKGEITQLGASNIIFGCYDSESFPNDPLCDLFVRSPAGSVTEYNITDITDQFVNIASQRNSGVDVEINLRHDLGNAGRLSFTAGMTFQTRDDFKLLPTSPTTSDNGEAGSPDWVGDFRATWESRGGFTFFYGMNVYGGTSDVQDFLDRNGGDPCIDSSIYGRYCPKLTTPTTFYHNVSISQEINDRFEITFGIANLFDTRPPRVSVLNGGQIALLGPAVLASQYPFTGRRAFLNISSKF